MSLDYSLSLTGMRTAERNLERAASRIAAASASAKARQLSRDRSELPSSSELSESGSGSAPIDYAAELIEASQAKTAYRANARVVSLQQTLEKETLDLLA